MRDTNWLKRIKQKFGANGPGLTVAVIAMVVAMAGGAFAASGGLTGKQKKEVTSIAKNFAGKTGKTGKTGATGPAGAAGKDGGAGSTGPIGSQGKEGDEGPSGKSVVIGNTAPGCTAGGKSVEVEGLPASKKEICNGTNGTTGFTETLPAGKTETGAWAVAGTEADENGIRVPISFAIPLGDALQETHVHHFGEANFATSCPGSAVLPTALPGELCVYLSNFGIEETELVEIEKAGQFGVGAGTAGAVLIFSQPTDLAAGEGTFAVTAPAGP